MSRLSPLDQIAADYHYNTEIYDRVMCSTSLQPGFPVTDEERRNVALNAGAELGFAKKAGADLGHSPRDVEQAISAYAIRFDFDYEHSLRKQQFSKSPLKIV